MTSLGIDIGGSSVKLAAIQSGNMLWTGQSSSYRKPTRSILLTAIREALEGHAEKFSAVGVCVPGRLDAQRNAIAQAVNLPDLQGVPLDQLAAEAIGYSPAHFTVVNDTTAGAYDVFRTYRLEGRLLVLTLGTGVGMAVLDDGGPLRVSGESPGHIGQVDVSIETAPVIGPDGGAGSLEGYIGAPALVQRYGPDMAANLAKLDETSPPFRALARAVRICHAIYRPQHIFFTGGIGTRLRHLLPAIRKLIETNLTSVARIGWNLECADDEFHAAKGAARLAATGDPR